MVIKASIGLFPEHNNSRTPQLECNGIYLFKRPSKASNVLDNKLYTIHNFSFPTAKAWMFLLLIELNP